MTIISERQPRPSENVLYVSSAISNREDEREQRSRDTPLLNVERKSRVTSVRSTTGSAAENFHFPICVFGHTPPMMCKFYSQAKHLNLCRAPRRLWCQDLKIATDRTLAKRAICSGFVDGYCPDRCRQELAASSPGRFRLLPMTDFQDLEIGKCPFEALCTTSPSRQNPSKQLLFCQLACF